ncbi:transcriptional regulator [Moorella thermoacetica]|uniref:Transcriptional regulator, XRE family n=1 Tax=Moorella thermoacetica (strain ATCC 39073 / JCM 9320) TaxID=264732 RepID=Q2RLS7_MOOTA|nr:helix-turn-helix domain-containing protein [Moorella thermoacetica]AKX95661.1 HTH-type transcriptional regulator ImmR [Moorella thermoacetica]OIQ11531.1 HTH-type transcriptional regulator ImmR [Moorella thermoacetica]OIQ53493.1 HTH-type transcriptional regulator ImmR [Moorella thermoacetica]OIQ59958.1 HTH-type transcriptional regulator ImmR [Moorella thermoacetica]QCZ99470.1 HTH-type transcriptional regulator ImmR [Moorella thermoacetica]
MSIGKRIKELREKIGLTQEELAERVQISRSALANYESGYREPKGEILVRFAKALNTSTDFLLGNEVKVDKTNDKTKKYELDEATLLFARLSNLTPEGREKVLRELEWIEELERKRFLERKKKQNQEKN